MSATPSALRAAADSTAALIFARGGIALLALAVPWYAAEMTALRRDVITLGERQVAIADRVSAAVAEDRRRIDGLEQARDRGIEANTHRTREIADMTGALRELNAVLRGMEQRIDLLRLERRGGAMMQEIPG